MRTVGILTREEMMKKAVAEIAMKLVFAGLMTAPLGGCVTLVEVNEAFKRVERIWELEYQRNSEILRARAVEASPTRTMAAVRTAFLQLGMPIQKFDLSLGLVIAENAAPAPLTLAEWQEVTAGENARIKEIGGWFLTLDSNPRDYVVGVKADVQSVRGITVVVLDYTVFAPKYRAMGIQPPKVAPPRAVQLATDKFWRALTDALAKDSIPAPRQRKGDELIT